MQSCGIYYTPERPFHLAEGTEPSRQSLPCPSSLDGKLFALYCAPANAFEQCQQSRFDINLRQHHLRQRPRLLHRPRRPQYNLSPFPAWIRWKFEQPIFEQILLQNKLTQRTRWAYIPAMKPFITLVNS